MFKIAVFAVLALAAADVPQGTYPSLSAAQIEEEFPKIANEYIVVFKAQTEEKVLTAHMENVKTLANVHREYHIAAEDTANSFRGYHVTVTDEAHLTALKAMPEVDFVEQNAVVKASKIGQPRKADCDMQSGATWGITRTAEVTNDKNSFYSYGSDGEGVTAYIIDTGIRCSHQEFRGRCTWGFDSANFPSPNTDLNGHGTHVAGTVGGTVYGLAKKVQLVGVAVLSASGSGSTAGVIAGVEWSVNDARGKKAIGNMSLGGGFSTASNNAVNAAFAAGLPMVVASGNSNTNSCTFSPASATNALTVDSSDSVDRRSSFSNYGSCSDIVAPGSMITAAWINSDTSISTISGTSMASPHVAGVGAKMLSEQNYTPAQLYGAIKSMATPNMVTGFPNNAQPLLHMDCEGARAAVHPDVASE
jgi:subtilisin family serine protease